MYNIYIHTRVCNEIVEKRLKRMYKQKSVKKGSSSKRGRSRGRRQRGGNYENIVDPLTNTKVNVKSNRGKQLLQIYSKLL